MFHAEQTAKKVKLDNEDVKVETHCGHWVPRKKRFCKMSVVPGRGYCAEHEPIVKNIKDQDIEDNDRIMCPLDATHTVYKKNLRKHLKICNSRPVVELPDYILNGVNAGETVESTATLADCAKLKLCDLEDTEFYATITKVKDLYEKYVQDKIETLDLRHKLLDEELAKTEYGKEARKHLLQTAALLGILEQEQQLRSSTSYVEFGAGKGQLAFYLAQLLQLYERSQVVLVDRLSLRHKKDNKVEDRSLVHRIRADIADFHMPGLELLRKTERCVAVSKHLCGAATDLTLRCITKTPKSSATTEFIIIALCCHHRCEWRSFVGKEFLAANGIDVRQFTIISKMVSWAICGTGMSRDRRRALEEQNLSPVDVSEQDSKLRLTLSERERIGFMCKRVLDVARIEFLRGQGYDAKLKYYVPKDITLENVCLLARKI